MRKERGTKKDEEEEGRKNNERGRDRGRRLLDTRPGGQKAL